MPDTPETIIAFDFGTRRIGAAVGQQVTGGASPLAAIKNRDSGPDWQAIGTLIRDWQPARLVVGMPLRVDGSKSDVTARVLAFIDDLQRFELPVDSEDERYSSIEAEQHLKTARQEGRLGRIRKEQIDSAAACVIAERWLAKIDH